MWIWWCRFIRLGSQSTYARHSHLTHVYLSINETGKVHLLQARTNAELHCSLLRVRKAFYVSNREVSKEKIA